MHYVMLDECYAISAATLQRHVMQTVDGNLA
jgi:hypothetical protein